jgi:PIN domain nuclease of toxin-antitoxin system
MIMDESRLPSAVIRLLEDEQQAALISVVSLLEMQIKIGLGKLTLPHPLQHIASELERGGFSLLPIDPRHIYAMEQLPRIHNDPFDRLLAAQALSEQVVLITADPRVQQYPISWVWE